MKYFFHYTDVRMLDGAIDSLEPDDIRLRNVKVVLIHGQCSKTAVLDPVGFVITEGEGWYFSRIIITFIICL